MYLKINKIHAFYFSPSNSTKKIINKLTSFFNIPTQNYDLLKNPINNNIYLSSTDLYIVALPVYMGRVPAICVEMLNKIKGNNALSIAVVVYGNRAYEDALIELTDIIYNNNFSVIGAGAFIAQHSIFPSVGKDRPNEFDLNLIEDFAKSCIDIIENISDFPTERINVKGSRPYRLVNDIPLTPRTKNTCEECGLCAIACPTNSINKDSPKEVNQNTCISCGTCITSCPLNSRYFGGLVYKAAKMKFEKENSFNKLPEVFFINNI